MGNQTGADEKSRKYMFSGDKLYI